MMTEGNGGDMTTTMRGKNEGGGIRTGRGDVTDMNGPAETTSGGVEVEAEMKTIMATLIMEDTRDGTGGTEAAVWNEKIDGNMDEGGTGTGGGGGIVAAVQTGKEGGSTGGGIQVEMITDPAPGSAVTILIPSIAETAYNKPEARVFFPRLLMASSGHNVASTQRSRKK